MANEGGINRNAATCGLAVDLIELHGGHCSGRKQLIQYAARSYGRELIGVAHQYELAAGG